MQDCSASAHALTVTTIHNWQANNTDAASMRACAHCQKTVEYRKNTMYNIICFHNVLT